ncbi:MAG: DUF4410 domain-containing protein [Candidatus Binatus sp.]|jgi:hypothetical protein|uniref:DUF4410 domain-containing protein n=1 Tax=Candidatus Binatus sp. TaxID=2811406 RepID=UPI003C9D6E5C
MKSKILSRIYVLLALAAFGCAGAQVTQQSSAGPVSATPPTAVIVYPFAVDPSDVTLNQSIFQRAYRNVSGEDESAQQLDLAHQTAQNICVQVAADLTQKGITTTCLQRGVPPAGSNVLILDGQFTDISEGNRLRRMVIGLGAGASKVDTVVQVIQKTDQGTTEIIDFSTSADSGYMPGAGITGPAGAAAGGAAAAASIGVNIAAGGVKNVTSSTGYLVGKTSDQIVQQVVNYYNRQGWSS